MKKTSTTNILAKIFKKNPGTKVKKKVTTKVIKKQKSKVIKKNISKSKSAKVKVVKSTSKKKLKTSVKNPTTEKVEVANNLRISKNNEVKPEIKKVKKQSTEKREYKVKDYVVYPKHGVGQITEFKKINIGGIMLKPMFLNLKKIKQTEWYLLINRLTLDLSQQLIR